MQRQSKENDCVSLDGLVREGHSEEVKFEQLNKMKDKLCRYLWRRTYQTKRTSSAKSGVNVLGVGGGKKNIRCCNTLGQRGESKPCLRSLLGFHYLE